MWPHNDSSMTEYTFDGGTTSWNRQHPHSKRKESGEVVLIHQPEVQAGIRTFLIVVKFGSHLQVSVVLGCYRRVHPVTFVSVSLVTREKSSSLLWRNVFLLTTSRSIGLLVSIS